MKPELSTRQAEVAGYVAQGLATKVIAARTELSIKTVEVHIHRAAAKIPGVTPPRHRLTLWFYDIQPETDNGSNTE